MTTKIILMEKGVEAYKIIYNGREVWQSENMTLRELWKEIENDDRPPYEEWSVCYTSI
ncbi:MAG: hypothetical protein ACTSPB_11945 [Candidatus Thorarchaeota archaeon]